MPDVEQPEYVRFGAASVETWRHFRYRGIALVLGASAMRDHIRVRCDSYHEIAFVLGTSAIARPHSC